MDRIVVTDLAKTYFDTPANPDRLPLLKHSSSKPANENTLPSLGGGKHAGSLSVLSLRRLLKNESVQQLQKLRQRSEKRNYTKVREELLRDISNGKQFLSLKADQIARRILAEKDKCEGLNVGIEISKGKNYLNKIIKDFENMQSQKDKINEHIQDRMKGEQQE